MVNWQLFPANKDEKKYIYQILIFFPLENIEASGFQHYFILYLWMQWSPLV